LQNFLNAPRRSTSDVVMART